MDLKALLCSSDDESPQHWSVLGTINTLNSPKRNIRLLGGLSGIHSMRRRGAKGLVWGARGPFPPAAAMVGYGCVVCRLVMYRTKVLMYRTMVLLARLTKVRC